MITLYDYTTGETLRIEAERIDDQAAARLLPQDPTTQTIYIDFRERGSSVIEAMNRTLLLRLAAGRLR